MKRIFLLMILILIPVYGQVRVKTLPQDHSIVNVYADTLKGAAVNTSAIRIDEWTGTLTAFCYADTTDSGTPGTLGIAIWLYNLRTAQWYEYHDLGNFIDVAAGAWAAKYFYIDLTEYQDHAWGDSLRLKLTPQSADTGYVSIDLGGQ